MRFSRIGIAAAAAAVVLAAGSRALAQEQSPTATFDIDAGDVTTWNDNGTTIVLIDGPVKIKTDQATITGRGAVIWFEPIEGSVLNRRRADVALLNDARLEQGQVVRTGSRLFVSAVVNGKIRLTASNRQVKDLSDTELYKTAADLRPIAGLNVKPDQSLLREPIIEPDAIPRPPRPTTAPVEPKAPVTFRAKDVQTSTATTDGKLAVVLTGGVLLIQERANGEVIELRADRAVLFTALDKLGDLTGPARRTVEESIAGAYLEGDVRVTFTPADTKVNPEQRLSADSVYYEFNTDRAVTTQAVLHTTDPMTQLPVTVRADTIRQLALGEYTAQGVELSTSNFRRPSYAVRSSKLYVRQYQPEGSSGTVTQIDARNATLRSFGIPVFYLPRIAGEVPRNGLPLRGVQIGASRGFGFGVQTEWGLFSALGVASPPGLDASFKLDYFTERGPALGLDAKYKGGYVTEDTKEPWNFEGDFSAYIVPNDTGQDRLSRDRLRIGEDGSGPNAHPGFRGRVQWQHQHFFPNDWQLQLRAGYVTDPTFLEEWFENQFDNGLPTNLSAYLKRQKQTEAITFLLEYQPNDYVTTAEGLQERFATDANRTNGVATNSYNGDTPFEIDRLPELGYYRVGDSFNNDTLTFFSENRVGGLQMHRSDATLSEYGFRAANGNNPDRFALVGIPSYGYTGTTDNYVGRVDTRQEIDYPFAAGQFKIVPYAFGRVTGYTDSPDGDARARLMAGAGVRVTTAFSRIDDSAQSDFFDIHRVRHVIEPELHLFTSAATRDRDELYVFDEDIDGISDISAVSLWLRQRWQTKRGGPGRWRSVDFLALNVGINAFANQPTEPATFDSQAPGYAGGQDAFGYGPSTAGRFRGLYFPSMPEASLARTGINADGLWRVSDTTTVLADGQYNLDEQSLATVAAGLAVQRDERLSYYTGLRYIGGLDSTIASFNSTYKISFKYSMLLNAAVDLNKDQNQSYGLTLIRKFDRFVGTAGFIYDAANDEAGFRISIVPSGLGFGFDSNALQNAGFSR